MNEYSKINLAKSLLNTGNDFGNALSNTKQLIEEHQTYLEIKDIYMYDKMAIAQAPAVCIVFDTATMLSKSLGRACNLLSVKLVLYFYFETLTPGKDTYPHICRLGNLARAFYDHPTIYTLCHSEPATVDGVELVGRRLDSGVYLTGQVNLTLPIRFCTG